MQARLIDGDDMQSLNMGAVPGSSHIYQNSAGLNQSSQSKNIGHMDAMLKPPNAFAGNADNVSASAGEDMMSGGDMYGLSEGGDQ